MRPTGLIARRSPTRRGLTLLEVLLSVAILGLALAVIGNLTGGGVRAALRCEHDAEAATRCQSQLDLLLAGAAPLRDSRWQPCEDDARWEWSVSIEPGVTPSVAKVTVAVRPVNGTEFALTQLVRRSRLAEGAR